VIGRKNWLFSQTAKGATVSAVLYSIIETAKANSQVPFDCLNHLLTPNEPTRARNQSTATMGIR